MAPAYWQRLMGEEPRDGARDGRASPRSGPGTVPPPDKLLDAVLHLPPRLAGRLWWPPWSKSLAMDLDGHEVAISNPDKVFFPASGVTKGDLVEYYLAVADGALRGVRDRPMALKRFVNGVERRGFLPEARAGIGPGLREHRGAGVPVGTDRRRGRRQQPRRAGLGGEPGVHRPQPASDPRRRRAPPRRAAGRPGPRTGGPVGGRPGGGARGARGPRPITG